jgi:hypothetical protein
MERRKIFPCLVTKREHKLLRKLSRAAKLPMAAMVRRLIVKEAAKASV